MKNNELNMNEMEQVSGGNPLSGLVEVLKNIFRKPVKPRNPATPIVLTKTEPAVGRSKC